MGKRGFILKHGICFAAAAAIFLSACQSSGTALQASTETDAANAEKEASASAATAYAASGRPAQCRFDVAGGPPPKPSKGADFGKAAAKNVGKNISRNLISNIGARIAGPIGGAVAGGVAASQIRAEQDLSGEWSATDGAQDCGCTVDIRSATNLNLKVSNNGRIRSTDCGNPLLSQIARWKLGHSFTGYNAKFELLAKNGSVLATLNRDGVNYFSGTLADGTPVTLWRRGG